MVMNRKPTGRASSMPAGIGWGIVTELSVTVALAALLAKLVETERMQESAIGYGVMVILVLASFVGAWVSAAKIKRQRLVVCLLSAVIYFALLLSMTALFFGGQYSGVGETGLLIFCGSMLGVFTGYGGKTGRKRQKFRLHNR